MKTRRIECNIYCPHCKVVELVIFAEEDSTRPGFWSNTSDRPAKVFCENCGDMLERQEPGKQPKPFGGIK